MTDREDEMRMIGAEELRTQEVSKLMGQAVALSSVKTWVDDLIESAQEDETLSAVDALYMVNYFITNRLKFNRDQMEAWEE